MKTIFLQKPRGLIITGLISISLFCSGQKDMKMISSYLTNLPADFHRNYLSPVKLKMTALYVNMDLYGNVTDKTRISGEYTRTSDTGTVFWNNVKSSSSTGKNADFSEPANIVYMENFTYKPSEKMLNESAFSGFPSNPQNVLARNLVWDMMAIENFAWNYLDSLKLNKTFDIRDASDNFNMGEIGKYDHESIQLTWTGISQLNSELCALMEFRALYNKLELTMGEFSTSGTEQYWGTIWVSLKTGNIKYAEMFGGTLQEIKIPGLENKFLVKTVRELKVEII